MPRHIPPSRIRYEKANPVISVRLTASLKRILDEFKEKEGISYADLVKRGLETYAREIQKRERRGGA